MEAWQPTECLFVSAPRCDECSAPSAWATDSSPPDCLARLERACHDSTVVLDGRDAQQCGAGPGEVWSNGACTVPEPFCAMTASTGPCRTPTCVTGAAKALRLHKAGAQARREHELQRLVVDRLTEERQRLVSAQQRTADVASAAEAEVPRLTARVRTTVEDLQRAHAALLDRLTAGKSPEERERITAAHARRLRLAERAAMGNVSQSADSLRTEAQKLQAMAGMVPEERQGLQGAVQRSLDRAAALQKHVLKV